MMFDHAVVGAGAAGIAAARTLLAAGYRVIILEALPRIGGRAFTEIIHGYPFDWGCHWLHSGSVNVLRMQADRLGVRYRKTTTARRLLMTDGIWADEALLAERHQFIQQCEEAAVRAARGGDGALAQALPNHNRWGLWHRNWLTLLCSFEAEAISVVDYIRHKDTQEDWPVVDGYGALIEALAEPLTISSGAMTKEPMAKGGMIYTGAMVQAVTRLKEGVVLHGEFGNLRVKGVVITVSTSALAAQNIHFTPELPDEITEAVNHIPVGRANKILFPITGELSIFPEDTNLVDHRRLPQAFSFYTRPYGRALVVAHCGGDFAAVLEVAGESTAVAEAREQVADLLGSQALMHLGPGKASAWGQIPTIKGAYSSALPGHAHRRECLAAPFDERIQLAGEACSMTFYSTAHGAFESGVAAAKRLLDSRLEQRRYQKCDVIN